MIWGKFGIRHDAAIEHFEDNPVLAHMMTEAS